jgi:hypothetical protein
MVAPTRDRRIYVEENATTDLTERPNVGKQKQAEERYKSF